MAPLPKRRRSKASQGSHQAHRHATILKVTDCPHCHKPMVSHRVCPSCGYYRGRDMLKIESVNP